MTEARLIVSGVKKRYGATAALQAGSLTVGAGSIHALLGENGAGKSTLVGVLSGAVSPDGGSVQLDGASYRPGSPVEARRAGVATIFQELSLCPHLTVAENICLGNEPTKGPRLDRSAMKRVSADALKLLGRSDISSKAMVGNLPIGERQIVEIARALSLKSKVLILDEPTSSLAANDVESLFRVLRSLKDQGLAVIYISHFLDEVRSIADQFTILRDGSTVATGEISEVSSAELAALMMGREIGETIPRSRRVGGELALRIEGIAGVRFPNNATLELRFGEVVGLAGLMGSGRTELLRTVFGLDAVRQGRVSVGAFVGRPDPHSMWKCGTGFVSEDRKAEGLAVGMTIADNVLMASTPRFASDRQLQELADPALKAMGVKMRSSLQRVRELSGGNQQKVAIARLLASDVDVLLLDEPTRGIDVGSKSEIYRWIDQAVTGDPTTGRKPKAVLMSGSSLEEVLGVCDRVVPIWRGSLGASRASSEWTEPDLIAAIAGGIH